MSDTDTMEWRGLAQAALVPAPGASPAWAEPLLQNFPSLRGARAKVANGAFAGFALSEKRLLPWPLRQSPGTPLTFQGVPLLARGDAAEALRDLVGHAPLLLRGVPADGPFWHSVEASGLKAGIVNTWQRAALKTEGDFTAWFETNFERKRRKEFRRLRARLGEAGALATVSWRPGEAVDSWTEEFLALEAGSWKGKRGTALASDPAAARALREALRNLSEDGALRFWKLTLDGRAIAMLFATVMGGTAWLGKIAHDEAYAKFSPGVLMILDASEAMMADPEVTLADSCAKPGHPMIDSIWRDRLAMADVLLAPRRRPLFGALLAAERARNKLRGAARDAVNRVLKRKSS